MAIFWIWYAITIHDVVYLIFGTITAVCGTIIHCYPMKIEIYDNGIKFNRKFYRWSELKAYRSGEYMILNVKKGIIIPLPTSKLNFKVGRILQEIIDDE